MSKYTTGSYRKSISYATKGLRVAIKSQKNFRFQLGVACVVLLVSLFMNFSNVEFCVLFLTCAMVLVAELFNSAIEFALDAVFQNKKNTLVGFAKDMSAGAVLLTTYVSIIVGFLLFVPKLYDLILLGYYWY